MAVWLDLWLATSTDSLVVGSVVLKTSVGGLVARDTLLAMVLSLKTSLTELSALATLVARSLILVICLKKFTCHSKHLKIFY